MLVRTRSSIRWGIVVLVAVGVGGAACSLNPQPLPPDTEGVDASVAGTPTGGSGDASVGDSALAQNGDASGSGDGGGTIPVDGEAPPPGDAQADGGDANNDDAGDASVDGGEGDALGEGD